MVTGILLKIILFIWSKLTLDYMYSNEAGQISGISFLQHAPKDHYDINAVT